MSHGKSSVGHIRQHRRVSTLSGVVKSLFLIFLDKSLEGEEKKKKKYECIPIE